MKLRKMKGLPVFSQGSAEIMGQVDKAVIGDDFALAYLVVNTEEGSALIKADDLDISEDAIIIRSPERIKSYACGEELSIYEKKLSDTIFDEKGREMGWISDFILCRRNKKIWGIELCSGAINDLLEGRREIPLEQVCFKSDLTGVVNNDGSDKDDREMSGVQGIADWKSRD